MSAAEPIYRDRGHAGRTLGEEVARVRGMADPIVLALPRGGVPVAFEVAEALDAPLDLILVRKLGAPGQEEIALGAIASGGVRVLNEEIIRQLRVTPEQLEIVAARERVELRRREQAYRGGRPYPQVADRTAVLVDDGLATGATMRAAARALRQLHPASVVVAVPVAPLSTIEALRREVDDVVCPASPAPFFGVGMWYGDFTQTTDAEVRALLGRAWRARSGARHQEAP